MLSEVNTHLVKFLALRLVHCDGIAQPKWELASFDGQSTLWQVNLNIIRKKTNLLCPIKVSTVIKCLPIFLTTFMLFMYYYDVHQPILYRDVSCYHAQTMQPDCGLLF